LTKLLLFLLLSNININLLQLKNHRHRHACSTHSTNTQANRYILSGRSLSYSAYFVQLPHLPSVNHTGNTNSNTSSN